MCAQLFFYLLQSSLYPLLPSIRLDMQRYKNQAMSWMDKYGRMIDEQTLKKILLNPNCDQKCELLHGGDCNVKAAIQFFMGARSVFKIYFTAHIVPFLLFKLRKLRKNPRKQLWKFVVGLVNSLIFAGLTSAISRRLSCIFTKYLSFNYTIARFPPGLSGVAILFESPSRQTQIALVCLSKAWESIYQRLKRRQYPIAMPWGNLWLNGIGCGLIGFVFVNEPLMFRESYRTLLRLLFNDV